jgi:hypothetical protein
LVSLDRKEITVECRQNGVVMATENSTHRYLFFRDRFGLEHDWQVVTPFGQVVVKDLDSALQFQPLLWFQVVLAIVDGVYFS